MTTIAKEEAQAIAQEIFRQFGGNKAAAMIGMSNRAYSSQEDGTLYVSFRFKGSRKANYCKITLNSKDLYDMEIGKIRGMNYKVVEEHYDIYADMMSSLFEKATQLYLSF